MNDGQVPISAGNSITHVIILLTCIVFLYWLGEFYVLVHRRVLQKRKGNTTAIVSNQSAVELSSISRESRGKASASTAGDYIRFADTS